MKKQNQGGMSESWGHVLGMYLHSRVSYLVDVGSIPTSPEQSPGSASHTQNRARSTTHNQNETGAPPTLRTETEALATPKTEPEASLTPRTESRTTNYTQIRAQSTRHTKNRAQKHHPHSKQGPGSRSRPAPSETLTKDESSQWES